MFSTGRTKTCAFPGDSLYPRFSNSSARDPGPPMLAVSGLSVTYRGAPGHIALREVNLQVATGEVLGILGESGCGKSTLALSILGLLPATAAVEGSIRFRGVELRRLPESNLRAVRGAKISLIHQEPGLSLSPLMRIGSQIGEVIRAHRRVPKRQLQREAESVLAEVHLPDPQRISNSHPHQLSGGELSRVMIAQAVACLPDLLIADEPTRSLDVRVQAEILRLLREINQKLATAIIFITHNPALLAGLADRIAVLHAGEVVEQGPARQVLRQPQHVYTQGLMELVPRSLQGLRAAAGMHRVAYGN